MSCGFSSSSRVFLSVHQYMRNTLNTNKEIFLYRRFNTLKKGLKPVSLVKLSQHPIKNSAIRYDQDRSNLLLKKHQIEAVPLPCTFCSNVSKPAGPSNPAEAEKTGKTAKPKKKEKVGIYSKFKTMFKEYWYVLVPVHIVTSCFWFGSFYWMACSGMDIPALMESLGAPDSWIEKFKSTKAGNLFVAYTLYKVVTPLRYTVTVGGTTISIKYLKQLGWIKPVPNKEQLKKIYEEQKGVLKDFKATCQDKMQVTKSEFNKSKKEMKEQIEMAKEMFHRTMKETRDDFKEGARGGAEEWRMISKSFKAQMKESFGSSKNHKND